MLLLDEIDLTSAVHSAEQMGCADFCYLKGPSVNSDVLPEAKFLNLGGRGFGSCSFPIVDKIIDDQPGAMAGSAYPLHSLYCCTADTIIHGMV